MQGFGAWGAIRRPNRDYLALLGSVSTISVYRPCLGMWDCRERWGRAVGTSRDKKYRVFQGP